MQKSTKILLLLLGSSSICATYFTTKFNTLALKLKILDIALLITSAVCLVCLVFKIVKERQERQERQERKKRKKNLTYARNSQGLSSSKERWAERRRQERQERQERKKRKKRKKILIYARNLQGNLTLSKEDGEILGQLNKYKIKGFYIELARAILAQFQSRKDPSRKFFEDMITSSTGNEIKEGKEVYQNDYERGISNLVHEKYYIDTLYNGIKESENSRAVLQYTQGEISLQLELNLLLLSNLSPKGLGAASNWLGVLNPNGVFRYTQLTTNILTMLYYHKREDTKKFIEYNLQNLETKGLSAFFFICASKNLFIGPSGREMRFGFVPKDNRNIEDKINKYKKLPDDQVKKFNPAQDIAQKELVSYLNLASRF